MADRNKTRFFVFNVLLRLWCIGTVIVLWVCSINLVKDDETRSYAVSWYLLIVTIISTLLELIWMMNKMPWFQEDGCFDCLCWKVVRFVSKWKKGIFYILLSLPTFWMAKDTKEAIIGGTILLVAGILLIFRSVISLLFREDSEERKYFLENNPIKSASQEMATQTE